MVSILIVRIMGESLDLATGVQRPKSVVLSNGRQEETVEVPDELVSAILRLSANGTGRSTPEEAPSARDSSWKRTEAEPPTDEAFRDRTTGVASI